MEDLEDIARSADADLLGGGGDAAGTSRGGGGGGSGAGVVRFRRAGRRSPAPAPAAADDLDDDNTLSTPTPPSFKLDSFGLGGSSAATPRVWLRTFGCAHNVADSETMAGVLKEAGFEVRLGEGDHGAENENDKNETPSTSADAWVINSCTVKGPSQAAVEKLVAQANAQGKPIVVAGCVPQGEPRSKTLEGASLLGVRQLDRVADVVSEALKGNIVKLTSVARDLPALDLPRVRRNAHVEIVPLSTGCLGRCTYCKTVHARGKLGSYPLEAVVSRVASAAKDPRVREVWLSSEDTGAYGRDIGTDLPTLLRRLVGVLPRDGRTMLRVGMTNPPYVLSYLAELSELLGGRGSSSKGEEEGEKAEAGDDSSLLPIFRFLHVPVQSGSDSVLTRMRREYSVADFEAVAAAVVAAGATLATDVIVGFPGETAEDAQATVDLINKWRPRATHVSKFYPRPGTPAAKWERPPARDVAARSRAVAAVVDEMERAWDHLVGSVQRVWVVDVATDGEKLVGHTRDYVQVLLRRRRVRRKGGPREDEDEEEEDAEADKEEGSSSSLTAASCLGASLGDVLDVEVTSASRWSVKGRVVKIVLDGDEAAEQALRLLEEGEEAPGKGEGEKAEAVVPAPRRRAAAASAASAAIPASPPPLRPGTPEAPAAAPRARGAAAEAETGEEEEAAALAPPSGVAFQGPPRFLSLLRLLSAVAVVMVSFAVAVALRGSRAERERGDEIVV